MLAFIILYILKKYGIDIEKMIDDNPFILKTKKPEDIKSEKEIDEILLNNVPPGLLLKYQLKLDNLKYVYIRKMLRTSVPYYEIVFDTHLNRSIPYAMLRNMVFYKSYIHKNNRLEQRLFTPPIILDRFMGKIPSNAIVVKLDLAGKYYTQLEENNNNDNLIDINIKSILYKSDGFKLEEFTIADFKANGFSDRNKEWYKKRQKNGNTGVFFDRVTYNRKTGNVTMYFKIIPSYIGIKNFDYGNGEIVNSVPNITKNGNEIEGKKQYEARVQFQKVNDIIGSKSDWMDLTKRDRMEILDAMIKETDVKVFSNDPSFLYQSTWHQLDSIDSSIIPFPDGIPDKGIWKTRQGGAENIFLTKHFIPIFEIIPTNRDKIAQAITNEFEKRSEI